MSSQHLSQIFLSSSSHADPLHKAAEIFIEGLGMITEPVTLYKVEPLLS